MSPKALNQYDQPEDGPEDDEEEEEGAGLQIVVARHRHLF
jgi:hypothetical protein